MARKTAKDTRSGRLFMDPSGQRRMFDKSLQEEAEEANNTQVECLGRRFANDDARRSHFLQLLKEKLADASFRSTEGFPKGEDEDILRLSDPPYYTACPNPFVADFAKHYGRPYNPQQQYNVHAFASDVSESRNNPFVNAHSYATKAPHQAIMRYILHYTQPGDLVFDGFCGTGMTAVAAQLCADPPAEFKAEVHATAGQPLKWGARNAIVGDLSPAATFIAANMTGCDSLSLFERDASQMLARVEDECAWMYRTRHSNGEEVPFDCIIWSDVFICGECSKEVVFWEAAVDLHAGKLRDLFPCPHCKAELGKRDLPRAFVTKSDPATRKPLRVAKQVPVAVVYYVGGKKFEKKPDKFDLQLIARIDGETIPDWFPSGPMMGRGERWGDTWRAGVHAGMTNVHHFFTVRNLRALACAWKYAHTNRLRFMLTSLMYKSSMLCGPLLSNYFAERAGKNRGGWVGKERSGTLFRPSISSEVQIANQIRSRMRSVAISAHRHNGTCIQAASITASQLPGNCVDYVFIDPPFGANRYYAELNFLWEAWLGVRTDQGPEMVESPSQGKSLGDYQRLMRSAFSECHRVLKPGRWMTVEFSNTSAVVWNAIQTAIAEAGFVVADVRALSKEQGSINAYTTPTAVKQDLVISAYKPTSALEAQFKVDAGSEAGAWDFVRAHLRQLPVFVGKVGQVEIIPERQAHMIFDRMIAFHIQRQVSVPYSAGDFYRELAQKFPERDGMYFLPEQLPEYDKARASAAQLVQLTLFVTDESSAIQWLRQRLAEKPQTFQEIHPHFMKEISGWQKHEQQLELFDLLRQNFICCDGHGPVPNQIHAYLSSNFKELRNLPKADAGLRERAKDRWYVPDPNKAGDLEKLRERALLAEFEEYKASKQRSLKVFRTEAVRAGFKSAYDRQDYKTIVEVAQKLPEVVLQEDEKLLMYYDVATMRLGDADKDKLFQ